MKNKKILFSALAITYVALLSSCEGEMPSANTNVIASTTTIEDTKTTALDENSSISTTNDSIISSTTEDTPTTENLKPELVVGGQYLFGSYPQTKVEASIENGLASIEFNSSTWIDYGYYVADEIQSYMYYYDVDINNDSVYDYRGVYFTSYRPSEVSLQNYEYNSDQMYNGYFSNRIHWFKYEPISWTILNIDSDKLLLFADLILDSQDYEHSTSSKDEGLNTIYSNNYQYSYLRSWLNDSFYTTAFNAVERNRILATNVDNSSSSTNSDYNDYCCENTKDNIFALSNKEISHYFETNESRITTGTDYAICQGLFISSEMDYAGNSCYWLRSPDSGYDYFSYLVSGSGRVDSNYVNKTHFGVRPACWIEL